MKRLILLVLLLSLPCLGATIDTLKGAAHVKDTYIYKRYGSDEHLTNYGASSDLLTQNWGNDTARILIRADSLGTKYAAGTDVHYCRLRLTIGTATSLDGDTLWVYPLDSSFYEGRGTGGNATVPMAGYRDSGTSWNYLKMPARPDTLTSTLPTYKDWTDNDVVSGIRSQGGCGFCYGFTSVGAGEIQWAIDHPSDSLCSNAGNDAYPDRGTTPTATKNISTSSWTAVSIPSEWIEHWVRLQWKHASLIGKHTGGGTELTIHSSEASDAANKWRLNVRFTYENTSTHAIITDTASITGTTDTYDTWISSVAPTTNYGGDATMSVVGTTTRMLLGFTDIRKSILAAMADSTVDTILTVLGAICSLKTSTYTGEGGDVTFYRGMKLWVEGEATWRNADASRKWNTYGVESTDLDWSEQQMLTCDSIGLACAGNSIDSALYYLCKDSLLDEEDEPWTGVPTSACPSHSAAKWRIAWAWKIDVSTVSAVKRYLQKGPMTMKVYNFQNFSSGELDTCCHDTIGANINHTVILLGWNDNRTNCGGAATAWKIKNSHGTDVGRYGVSWWAFGHGGLANVTNTAPAQDQMYLLSTTLFPRKWETAGGDFSATPIAYAVVTDSGTVTFDLDKMYIQHIVDGTYPNNGFMIKSNNQANLHFISTQGSANYVPEFEIKTGEVQTTIGKGVKIGKNTKIGRP